MTAQRKNPASESERGREREREREGGEREKMRREINRKRCCLPTEQMNSSMFKVGVVGVVEVVVVVVVVEVVVMSGCQWWTRVGGRGGWRKGRK